MPFSALLDACVLYPSTLRDTLLRLAEKELYRPLWSDQILEEMRRTILKDRPDLRSGQLDHLIGEMKTAFEEASVSGFEGLIEAMTNDPKDRHVLAAAVVGRADVIVTSNLKDFPDSACDPYSIEVQSPDEFLTHTFHLAPAVVMGALQEQARTNSVFPNTLDDVLKVLSAVAPTFVEAVIGEGWPTGLALPREPVAVGTEDRSNWRYEDNAAPLEIATRFVELIKTKDAGQIDQLSGLVTASSLPAWTEAFRKGFPAQFLNELNHTSTKVRYPADGMAYVFVLVTHPDHTETFVIDKPTPHQMNVITLIEERGKWRVHQLGQMATPAQVGKTAYSW